MELLITAKDAVLHLNPGEVLTVALPEELNAEQLDALVKNLEMGSLANHFKVKASGKEDVSFVAKYDTTSTGLLVKEGKPALSFAAPGEIAERIALGEGLLSGHINRRFTFVIAPSEADAPSQPPAPTNPPQA